MPTSPSRTVQVPSVPIRQRPGFTLIEVLVVIAIIGILVGLTVPAVNLAYRAIKQRAIGLECQAIATSVEAYRTKYGEYPPDGADPSLLLRHLRKVFPNIAPTEIALLTRTAPFETLNPPVANASLAGSVMDPTEALVFFLGGFSDDAVFPFSGKGGPLFLKDGSGAQVKSNSTAVASVQYNPDRLNPLYEFEQGQLTIELAGAITASGDDAIHGGAVDLIPAYHPKGLKMPFVYFDSRTYQQTTVANRYATAANGIVYPYRSTSVNTQYSATDTSVANRNRYFRFVNDKSFQVISAGLDDHFGGQSGLFYMYKPSDAGAVGGANSGDSLDLVASISSGSHPTPQYTRFLDSTGTSQTDNVTNFSQGTLEDSLSN